MRRNQWYFCVIILSKSFAINHWKLRGSGDLQLPKQILCFSFEYEEISWVCYFFCLDLSKRVLTDPNIQTRKLREDSKLYRAVVIKLRDFPFGKFY